MYLRSIAIYLMFFLTSLMLAQVSAGRIDDFQDGTVEGWVIGGNSTNQPINIDTDGPNGFHDRYLQTYATGVIGPNARMVVINNTWNGNYTSHGIVAIKMHVRAIDNDMNMRVAFQDSSTGTRICTTSLVNVTSGSGWNYITIPISASDFTVISGPSDPATVLTNIGTMRILHNGSPSWLGDYISATLELDNITASTTLGLSDNTKLQFSIYPNPGKSQLNINSSNFENELKIEVFNILGKRIISKDAIGLSTTIDISKWDSGVYLVRLKGEKTALTKRFIKQ